MSLTVTLVSEDLAFAKSCREVLTELFRAEWSLITEAADCKPAEHDVCIWDFTTGETASPPNLEVAPRSQHWFLVRPEDVAALQALVGRKDINILWKPLPKAALREVLLGARRHGLDENDGCPGIVNTLRVERDELLQFLIEANLKLQQSDQEWTNFLSRSLHDLSAPLTAILGYCGLLLEGELGQLTWEQYRVLKRMSFSAKRLARINSRIIQLGVSQKLEPTLNLEKADIRDCLDQAIDEVAPMLEDRRLSITADLETTPQGLVLDKAQIVETFVNLLDNACKFAPRESLINVRGYPFFWERRTGRAPSLNQTVERRTNQERSPNSYRVDFRDTGPAIPAADAERIFGERIPYGGAQDRSGGGLGLAICRMILHRHNGHIWAESSPGGALLCFVLPLQRATRHVARGDSSFEAQSGECRGGMNVCR